MSRPRLQFRLSTLLWITLAVACWFGGMGWQRRITKPREPWTGTTGGPYLINIPGTKFQMPDE
jgi:hypothetical protein